MSWNGGPELVAIAAMASNRLIGKDGKLPWHLPADLKFFKRTTSGNAILFGRKTFEGIGKPLPNRRNLVLSGSMPPVEGIEVLRHPEELQAMKDLPLVYICGGAEIYRLFFPLCRRLLLTRVEGDYAGDAFLPEFEPYFRFAEIVETGENYRIESWIKIT